MENTSHEEFDYYFVILKKRRWTIFLFTLMTVLTVSFYSFSVKPVYKATSTVLVDMETANVLPVKDVVSLGSDYWSYKEYLKTQIEILQGGNIASEILPLYQARSKEVSVLPEPISFFILSKIKREFCQIPGKFLGFGHKPDSALPFGEALRRFQKKLTISHVEESRLIHISFADEDPRLASEFANLFARKYVENNLKRKQEVSREARFFLQEELSKLRAKLEESEYRLQNFRKENNLISADERREIMNQSIIELNRKLTEADARLAEYRKRYQEKHPKMKQIEGLVDTLNAKIEEKRNQAILFEEKMIKYNALVREVNLTKNLFESVLNREKETLIAGSFHFNNISIVEPALMPERPFRPKKKMYVTLAFFFGLMGGILLALIMEFINKKIQVAEDFVRYQIPFLGYIPEIKQSLLRKRTCKDSYLLFNHKGIISEIFNNLRTVLLFRSEKNDSSKGKSLLFTSFLQGEGKTLVSCNIAIALAKFHFKTVLLEADLRKSRVKEIFQIHPSIGFSDLLQGNGDLESAIVPSPIENLNLLVNVRRPENPSELLGSKAFEDILKKLETLYDFVIIDSPPAFVVTDSVLMASSVKNVILVTKQGHVLKKLIPVIKQKLEVANARMIGVIINRVKNGKTEMSDYGTYYTHEY